MQFQVHVEQVTFIIISSTSCIVCDEAIHRGCGSYGRWGLGVTLNAIVLLPGDCVCPIDTEPKGTSRVTFQVPLLLVIFLSFVAQEADLNNIRRRQLI